MLRSRPSRVPLGMADVNQMQQRLKLKQASYPLVAQTDWAYIHHQQQKSHPPPQPHHNREGPQRSRDASLVQLDSNRHVPQSAIYESTDSAEDSDSDETTSATFESVARLVHIAEVSPTITQVSGYDPPALVNLPPQRQPVRGDHRFGATDRRHHHQLDNTLAPSRSRYDDGFRTDPDTRADYPAQSSRQAPIHFYQRDVGPRTTSISRRGQNPNAVSFAPRVHLGSPFQELDPQHRANIASVYRRGGTLRTRSSISRGTTVSRGGMNYQTRPRPMPMPRPRGSLMPRRPSVRAARRTGGHLRPPAASSIDTVMDRYPIFPSLSTQSNSTRTDNLFLESIPQRRGIPTPPRELRISHSPYSRSRFSSTTESQNSVSSRASGNSFSNATMLNQASAYNTLSSGTWDGHQTLAVGSVRSSRAGSRTSLINGSVKHQTSGLPPPQSPLDLLTQELRRLSTSLTVNSQSSLHYTSSATSTDGRLLSGNVFYSDSDDEIEERDTSIRNHPNRRGSTHIDGQNSDGRDSEFPNQPQHHLGIAARIVDVEADCQSATSRPLSTSPSTQSVSSIPEIDTLTDTPPGHLPNHPPTTPGQQLARPTGPSHISGLGLQFQSTPEVKVYDDAQPASMQPQTPADLQRRFRRSAGPTASVACLSVRTPARIYGTEYSRLVSQRNAHRNTYPSFQHASPQPPTTNSQPSSPYSPNLDLRTAAAITAVQRRRTARGVSNENVIVPSTNGMEAEREVYLRRLQADGTITIDDTPPRESRYERYISR